MSYQFLIPVGLLLFLFSLAIVVDFILYGSVKK